MTSEAQFQPDAAPVRAPAAGTPLPALWRRIAGGIVMGLGLVLLAFFLALAATVSLTFVEWRQPFDGVATVLMVCAPPVLAGALLLAIGRWIYGAWSSRAPLAHCSAVALPLAGVGAAFFAIAAFFVSLFAETGRGGAWALSQFLLCIVLSLGLVVTGLLLRRRPTD